MRNSDLFRGCIGVIGNYKTISLIVIVLYFLQVQTSYTEHTVRSIIAGPVGNNRLNIADRITLIIGKV